MKNTSKFQNVVIATIVGWLVLFVFLPNLMIIVTSFLTRDDANFVQMVFTLDNYSRLLDPLYAQVLLLSLIMAAIATLACLVLGYPFAWFIARSRESLRTPMLMMVMLPFWTSLLLRVYAWKGLLADQGLFNRIFMALGLIDEPLHMLYSDVSMLIGMTYIYLPFMVLPL